MLLNFPNGVRGSGSIPKVDVAGSNPVARSAACAAFCVPLFARTARFRTGVQRSNRYPGRDRGKAAVKALAMMAWISLLGSDPLVDPWENTVSQLGETEILTFHEPSDPGAWRLDDNELLNPFEQE